MRKLKSIFNTLYFAYLIISILFFVFKDNLTQQLDPEFLFRFTNFWIILGFAFFISIWVLQAIHIGFMTKEINVLEDKVKELKSVLYDINTVPEKKVKDTNVEESKTLENPEA